ncbi:hypothetical protein [Streptomyces hainanensis]|uniref:Uncharacterized protein n=1 Tax=Streptomyces hainanensis TaxID=402648 RepID=A0A4R4SGE6_9ACTN|nr:hypothetical protein [Streptomyces hainanensis]TDC62471.1 hypothetical protein E1283_34010 [Streptomyces hainanensis]
MSDPEIEAMSAVSSAFSELEDEARARVLRWAADKYGAPLSHTLKSGSQTDHLTVDANDAVQQVPGEVMRPASTQSAATYEHFADLYSAASPTTRQERVLVAAYWFQKVVGQETFQSSELNRELKHLGHYVDHVAEALSSNINKKPQLVLQVRKNGAKRQARKVYKLSGEGIKVVESMITLGTQR